MGHQIDTLKEALRKYNNVTNDHSRLFAISTSLLLMVKSYLWVGGNEIGFKGTRGMLVKKSLSIVVSPGIMFNEGIKI